MRKGKTTCKALAKTRDRNDARARFSFMISANETTIPIMRNQMVTNGNGTLCVTAKLMPQPNGKSCSKNPQTAKVVTTQTVLGKNTRRGR